jgi:hypothetical protein
MWIRDQLSIWGEHVLNERLCRIFSDYLAIRCTTTLNGALVLEI